MDGPLRTVHTCGLDSVAAEREKAFLPCLSLSLCVCVCVLCMSVGVWVTACVRIRVRFYMVCLHSCVEFSTWVVDEFAGRVAS